MDVLFVHPNFPGQFRRLATAFSKIPGLRVFGIGDATWMQGREPPAGVEVIGYPAPEKAAPQSHPWAAPFDAAVRRADMVTKTLRPRKNLGFEPDLIVTHPGWGDAFFLADYFPGARVFSFFEYFYRPRGADVGFDPEFPSRFTDVFRLRAMNTTQLLGLDACHLGFTPTAWQRDRFPIVWRPKLSVIHEGIQTDAVAPDPQAEVRLPDGATFRAGDEVLTYVSRNLEPYRGIHMFLRALPAILQARPNCHVVIVGGDDVSYSPRPKPGTTYRQKYLAEVADKLDLSRVHFTGSLPYAEYLKVLQVSRLHVYLTYPFILSWSMLEAMSAGCVVLGSATGPVEEVIQDGENGLLVPFFDAAAIAARAIRVLEKPQDHEHLRVAARETVKSRYDFESVSLPAYRRLFQV